MTITLDLIKEYLNSDSAYPYVSYRFTGDTFVGWQDDMQVLVAGVYTERLTMDIIDQVVGMAKETGEKEGHEYTGMVFIPGGCMCGGLERGYAKEKGVIVAVCQPTKNGFIHILESTR